MFQVSLSLEPVALKRENKTPVISSNSQVFEPQLNLENAFLFHHYFYLVVSNLFDYSVVLNLNSYGLILWLSLFKYIVLSCIRLKHFIELLSVLLIWDKRCTPKIKLFTE